ncbi:MAG TPA: hypothetical protein VHG92_06810 [Afifellaceae bacterium]|nr:hypothetical protein [Afifellaceae bacterium]
MRDPFDQHGSEAALYYLGMARKNIERVMGGGAAAEHPQIVAAMITAAAQDAHTNKMLEALPTLCEALRTDHPLQGRDLSGVEFALSDIANAIGVLASAVEGLAPNSCGEPGDSDETLDPAQAGQERAP